MAFLDGERVPLAAVFFFRQVNAAARCIAFLGADLLSLSAVFFFRQLIAAGRVQ
jgi:hypothetical protein